MPGFIHDKLEIKFLILYITARVIEPIPFDTVWDLAMCDEGVDYFDFAECLSDLVRTEHLTLSADGLYAITDKGLRNSRICESSLPCSVRLRCDKNLAACNRHLRRKSQVKASTEKRPNGTYTVRLELSDDMGSVMDLRLAIPREEVVLAMDAIVDPVSLYEPIYSEGGDTVCVMDQVSDRRCTDESWIQRIALKDAISRLTPRERSILMMRFNQGKTQMEVSAQIGISQAQVSRLEKGAIRTIKKEL